VKRLAIALAVFSLLGTTMLAAEDELVRKAPEFAFNIPGQGQKLLSQYRGKVVALEFIYTTCPHCQAASRLMTKLQQEYGARGLQVIDVAVNPNADLKVEEFVKDFQVGFPVGWATADQMTSFMNFSDGRFVVPQLALIDREGNIRYQTPALENEKWDKLMKEDLLRAHLEELLNPGSVSNGRPHPTSSRASAANKGS
jgi:thiol-disulfide isomerase/thioredoxin